MKERPILMSGPLVREILAGRKTMTRRPVKGPLAGAGSPIKPFRGGEGWVAEGRIFRCPYGVPGDRLWVRETFTMYGDGGAEDVTYRADGDSDRSFRHCDLSSGGYPDYCRSHPGCEGCAPTHVRWTPGIHMPRIASRLTLEMTAIRVERLWNITEEDAINEGTENLAAFEAKWREIYGAKSWEANPWVWVVSFRRVPSEERRP